MMVAVDNSVQVWADNELRGSASGWAPATEITMSSATTIVALQVTNDGGSAGVLASFSNGAITDASWRCTSSAPSGDGELSLSYMYMYVLTPALYGCTSTCTTAWRTDSFDASSWSVASTDGSNGVQPWGLVEDIAASAQWIWTSNTASTVYCRIDISSCLTIYCFM